MLSEDSEAFYAYVLAAEQESLKQFQNRNQKIEQPPINISPIPAQQITTTNIVPNKILALNNFLSDDEINLIQSTAKPEMLTPMIYRPSLQNDQTFVGGECIRMYNIALSKIFWQRLQQVPDLAAHFTIPGYTPVGINPFIRYHTQSNGHNLHPHFDTDLAHQFNNKYRTMRAYTLYLTTNKSGAIRFIDSNILDNTTHKYMDINYKGTSTTKDFPPQKGRMLIFDTSLLHCVTNIVDETNSRKVLVGEIVYKKVDL
jgi:hypothetical protein